MNSQEAMRIITSFDAAGLLGEEEKQRVHALIAEAREAIARDEATWLSQVRQGWKEIIRQVERHDRKVAAIMQQVHPREVHYEHREVIGETTYDFHLKMVNRPESLVLVSDAISDLIGERFRFRCERMHIS